MMAATETKQAILESIQEAARSWGGIRGYGYYLELPLLQHSEESPMLCRETPAAFEAVDSSFSATIHALFNAFHDFEKLSKTHDGDEFIRKEGLELDLHVVNQSFASSKECIHRRVIQLRMFPSRSGSAHVPHENVRPVSLRVPLELATRLPALRELDCPWMWEHMPIAFTLHTLRQVALPWAGPWRDARHEFGTAVQQLHEQFPASLTKARLWFWKPDGFYADENQGFHLPNLVRPAEADPVSLGLRTVASHLEDLDLRAIVTPDLFRAPVVWPRMKRLRVEFHPWCPDGTWYFVGPHDENPYPEGGYDIMPEDHYPPVGYQEGDDEIDEEYTDQEGGEEAEERDTDMFRIKPLQGKIEPLLSAFAAALKGMPALEEAELFTYLAWQPSKERQPEYEDSDTEPYNREDRAIYRWGVSYAPGKDGAAGQVTWQVGAWRPRDNVTRLFVALGREDGKMETVTFEMEHSYDITPQYKKPIVKGGSCPDLGPIPTKMDLDALNFISNSSSSAPSVYGRSLEKRAAVWGPVQRARWQLLLLQLHRRGRELGHAILRYPSGTAGLQWWDLYNETDSAPHYSEIEERGIDTKRSKLCNEFAIELKYPSGGDSKVSGNAVYGLEEPDVCESYGFGDPLAARVFFDHLDVNYGTSLPNPDTTKSQTLSFCNLMKLQWDIPVVAISGLDTSQGVGASLMPANQSVYLAPNIVGRMCIDRGRIMVLGRLAARGDVAIKELGIAYRSSYRPMTQGM
ncbi:hypothetical protein SCAR479_00323 [Seiridium cardinale]|uniref:Uncharacterized protein n=1 Tax=Seiridium cardinale TaxID=138064 RepID=A0ABR2Y969_9PEZI